MFGSVMDMFRGAAPTPAVQQQQQLNQQQQPGQQSNGLPVNPANPAIDPTKVAGQEPTQQGNVSPLDTFKDLWKNEPPVEGSPAEFDPQKLFNMDPAKLREATAQTDFTKSINPADLQAIQEGGEGAAQALMNILNTVQREALSTSVLASASMMQNGFGQAIPALDSRVSKNMRSNEVSSQLQKLNPALNHPATQPIVAALREQLVAKHPQASPEELAKMASDYFDNFGQIATGKNTASSQTTAKKGTDWNNFFTQPG